ncbi:MAG: endoglucanase [Desulfovibrio sp.]|nr:endoglucanase [Desulfovibrio sp.]MBI4960756.1 endoglucanase [Desulfovibrio sp.]
MIDLRARLVRTLAVVAIAAHIMIPSWALGEAKPSFGFVLDGYPIDSARLKVLRNQTGITPGMVTFFLQWPKNPDGSPFPLESVKAISQANALPCITWEPMFIEEDKEVAIDARDILSGRYDMYIDRFAQNAKQYQKSLMIRFAHEMNLERYHWGGPKESYGPQSPARYREMFRYVVKRFREVGAHNVFFAFCPNAESLPHPRRDNAGWNEAKAYYPGDDVVDVVGMDGYNWGTTQTREKHGWESTFRSFADIFGPIRLELVSFAPGKPVMVFETASAALGGDKAVWVNDALDTAKAWNLVSFNWFEADKEVDWRLMTGTGSSMSTLVNGKTDSGTASILAALKRSRLK